MENDKIITLFKKFLLKQDLSVASISSYLRGLSVFREWINNLYQEEVSILQMSVNDLVGFRETLSKIKRRQVSTINHRVMVLKRFYKWALQEKMIDENPADHLHFVRRSAPVKPKSLHKKEVHSLLRECGYSSHGFAKRNYAIVQIILQAGLRIGEVSNLQVRDLKIRDRIGTVRIIDSKGHKYRDVFLNATARRALKRYLGNDLKEDDYVFRSRQGKKMSVRSLQKVIKRLSDKVKSRNGFTAHTLRHTFATQYLESNPNGLSDLSGIMGHDSLNTTSIYTRPGEEKIASTMEKLEMNIYGE